MFSLHFSKKIACIIFMKKLAVSFYRFGDKLASRCMTHQGKAV